MNRAIQMLYEQHGAVLAHGPERCYLCGLACGKLHSVAKGIADTFNSHYLAVCPSSSWLCSACQWYFNDKSHPEFRKMSLIVTQGSWRNWARDEMKNDISSWLRSGLPDDAYLVVSLSKKKHILLQAPLNARGSHALSIQVEEQVTHFDLSSWEAIAHPFMGLLGLGHGKGEILSGDLYSNTLRKHRRLLDALNWSGQLEEWRNSPLIDLYSYATIIEKESEKKVGGDGGTATGESERSGTLQAGCNLIESSLERHGQGVSQQIQNGNMADVRGACGDSSKNYEQLDLFSF